MRVEPARMWLFPLQWEEVYHPEESPHLTMQCPDNGLQHPVYFCFWASQSAVFCCNSLNRWRQVPAKDDLVVKKVPRRLCFFRIYFCKSQYMGDFTRWIWKSCVNMLFWHQACACPLPGRVFPSLSQADLSSFFRSLFKHVFFWETWSDISWETQSPWTAPALPRPPVKTCAGRHGREAKKTWVHWTGGSCFGNNCAEPGDDTGGFPFAVADGGVAASHCCPNRDFWGTGGRKVEDGRLRTWEDAVLPKQWNCWGWSNASLRAGRLTYYDSNLRGRGFPGVHREDVDGWYFRVGVLPNREQKRSDTLESGKTALRFCSVVETSGASRWFG